MQINSINSQNFSGLLSKVKNEGSQHTFYFYHPYKDETYDMTMAAKQMFQQQLPSDTEASNQHFIIGKKLKVTRNVYKELKSEGLSDDAILDSYL